MHAPHNGPQSFDPRTSNEPLCVTREQVAIGDTKAWPFDTIPTGGRQKIVDPCGATVKQSQLDPYQISRNILPHVGQLLARIFLVPRHEVAATRAQILASFDGSVAPAKTPERFLSPAPAPGAAGSARTLNAEGSAEMVKIHAVALRRLRDQTLGGLGTRSMPKLAARPNMPQCPFGPYCIYLFYSYVLIRLFDLDGSKRSFMLWYQQIGTGADLRKTPMMVPVSIHPGNCHCPYGHSSDEGAVHEHLAQEAIEHMRKAFVDIAWRLANDVPVYSSPDVVRRVGSYDYSTIRRAVLEPSKDGDTTNTAIVAVIACAAIDNISDPRLVPTGQDHRQPDVWTALADQVKGEYASWNPDADTDVWGTPNGGVQTESSVPYMAHFDVRTLLKLPDPTPKVEVVPQGLAVAARLRAGRTVSTTEKAAEPAPRSGSASTNEDGRGPAVAVAPIVVSPAAEIRDSGASEEAARLMRPGYRRPLHGNRFVPRLISDSFLRDEGFKFDHWASLTQEAQHLYVRDRMIRLYEYHLEKDGPILPIPFAIHIMNANFGDPYHLFDAGQAYLALADEISRVAMDVV